MNLNYNKSYHLHCGLTLQSGHSIILEELHQEITYAGLMEGTPNSKANDKLINDALDQAHEYCLKETEPLLIVPPRRDYRKTPGDMKTIIKKHDWTPGLPMVGSSQDYLRTSDDIIKYDSAPEWLPMVQCIGVFICIQAKGASILTIVWFQDEYALPILEPALAGILEIDWEANATGIEL